MEKKNPHKNLNFLCKLTFLYVFKWKLMHSSCKKDKGIRKDKREGGIKEEKKKEAEEIKS